MEFWTAFMIGLAGSFHCIGMCGPIAFALPLPKNTLGKTGGVLAYNFGRITLYAAAGLVFGTIGSGLNMSGFQQTFSIVMGIFILIVAFFPKWIQRLFPINSSLFLFTGKMKAVFGRALQNRSISSLFVVGLLNGILPCGLVYLAIAGSVLTDAPLKGAFYMALFGLGTLPLMALVSFTGNQVKIGVRNRVKKFMPVVVVLFALLFILRGMNLGVPYLSPKLGDAVTTTESCH